MHGMRILRTPMTKGAQGVPGVCGAMMTFKATSVGPGPRGGHMHLQDYEGKLWDRIPVAIPSKGRAHLLCQQTLPMLSKHGYDMSEVHVFVHGSAGNERGSDEYVQYQEEMRRQGFEMVKLMRGGHDLREQYAIIFRFFSGVQELVLTTDTVPDIMVKRRPKSVVLHPLQQGLLPTIIRVGFDVCRVRGARAWSLASCKQGLNLSAGNISLKCGLLCGNFHGVRMEMGPPPAIVTSNYATDVEFSLRCWAETGSMVRFLGIAASHAYRSVGGLNLTSKTSEDRHVATCKDIESLSREFPTLIRTVQRASHNKARMTYKFCQKGPKPMKFYGTFETRGRNLKAGWRPMSGKQRMAMHRLRKRPAAMR